MSTFQLLPQFSNGFLLTFIVLSLLLGVTSLASRLILHRHRAALRHRLVVAAIMAHPILFVGMLVLPKISLEVLPAENHQLAATDSEQSPSPSIRRQTDKRQGIGQSPVIVPRTERNDQANDFFVPIPTSNVEYPAADFQRIAQADSSELVAPPRATEPVSSGSNGMALSAWLPTLPQALSLIWACVTALLAGYWLFAKLALNFKISNLAAPKDSEPLVSQLGNATRKMGISGPPAIRIWPDKSIPMQAGIFTPTIVIPVDFHQWSTDRRRNVLLHELAHVKRRDCFWDSLTWITCSLFWFNPLIWLLKKRQHIERELACDEQVITIIDSPEDYASDLVSIVRDSRSLMHAPVISMANASDLSLRVNNIIGFDPKLVRKSLLPPVILCVGLILATTSGSLFSLKAKQASENTQAKTSNEQEADAEMKETLAQRDKQLKAQYGDPIQFHVSASGSVVDEQGQPVAGASVFLRESAGRHRVRHTANYSILHAKYKTEQHDLTFARQTTNENGQFAFENVKAPPLWRFQDADEKATIHVYVEPPENSKLARHWQYLQINKEHTEFSDVEVSLGKAVQLTGSVTDKSGKPVSNAVVTASFFKSEEGSGGPGLTLGNAAHTPRVTTDASGNFVFDGLPGGYQCFVDINHADFALHPIRHFPAVNLPADSEAKFVIDRGKTILCRIRDENRNPLPDIDVNLVGNIPGSGSTFDIRHMNLKSDEQGLIRIPAIIANSVALYPRFTKDQPYVAPFVQVNLEDQPDLIETEIKATAGNLIVGQIFDLDGNPVSQLKEKELSVVASTIGKTFTDKTDSWQTFVEHDGTFQLRIPTGTKGHISVQRHSEHDRFDLPTKMENSFFNMRFGEYLESQRKHVEGKKKEPTTWRYRGNYFTPDPLAEFPSRQFLTGDERHDKTNPLKLPVQMADSVKGVVVDANGKPLAGARFELLYREVVGYGTSLLIPFQPDFETDESGAFKLRGIQRRFPPVWKVTHPDIEPPLFYTWMAGAAADDIELQMSNDRPTMLTVNVTLDGKPLPNQTVNMEASFQNTNRIFPDLISAVTNVHGIATFPQIDNIRYITISSELESGIEGREKDRIALQPRGKNLDVKFVSLDGIVSGQVVTPDGDPVSNVSVRIRARRKDESDLSYSRERPRRFESVKTDENGKFTSRKIPNGTLLRIEASPEPHENERYPRSPTDARVNATGGDTDIRIILDLRASHELPWR